VVVPHKDIVNLAQRRTRGNQLVTAQKLTL